MDEAQVVVIKSFFDTNGIFIAYIALFILALIPIYFGSFTGLKVDKPDAKDEFFSVDDAKLFPFIGSASLLSLYLVFKFLNKEYVNYILTAYFCLIGVGSLYTSTLAIIQKMTGLKLEGDYTLTITKQKKELTLIKFGVFNICLLVASVLFSAAYAVTKHWILTDIYGEAFAISAIQLLRLDSFVTGMILLAGLFIYDIFWVFGTDVMVTVAKSFDAPIKVLFPKNLFAESSFTMLGLGDIVIPGIYVALSLQFDYAQSLKKGGAKNASYCKPYFWSAFAAYCIGLITTVVVMHVFQAAQPALLYLSPACILSTLITALVRGELKEVMAFKANPELEKIEAKGDGPASSAGKRTKKLN